MTDSQYISPSVAGHGRCETNEQWGVQSYDDARKEAFREAWANEESVAFYDFQNIMMCGAGVWDDSETPQQVDAYIKRGYLSFNIPPRPGATLISATLIFSAYGYDSPGTMYLCKPLDNDFPYYAKEHWADVTTPDGIYGMVYYNGWVDFSLELDRDLINGLRGGSFITGVRCEADYKTTATNIEWELAMSGLTGGQGFSVTLELVWEGGPAGPQVYIDQFPTSPHALTYGEGLTFHGYAIPGESLSIVSYKWYVDGQYIYDGPYLYLYIGSYTGGSVIGEGVHYITLTATDDIGQTGTRTRELRIVAPPVCYISTFPGKVYPRNLVHFIGTATSTGGNIATVRWISDIDGTLGTVLNLYTDKLVTPGTHLVHLEATDNIGQVGQSSYVQVVVVPPEPPLPVVIPPGAPGMASETFPSSVKVGTFLTRRIRRGE